MNPSDSPQVWVLRLVRVAAAALLGAAILVWVTPVNSLGRNLVPVGCGSPATPTTDELADFVCRDFIGGAKVVAVCLAVAAGVLLLLSELVLPRLRGAAWLPGTAIAALVAVPAITLAVGSLFAIIAGSGADGTLIRCGTPLAPANDVISKSLCGQLADRDKTLAIGVMALSVLAMVGAGYVSAAIGPRRSRTEDDVEAVPSATDATATGATASGEPAPERDGTAYAPTGDPTTPGAPAEPPHGSGGPTTIHGRHEKDGS
ncbi:hypothetical protein N798_14515 [Knoellia flava TL1]|uniref:Uncharacterized protein n=2 Tax=Knoellia flava TaxID=913969 RepID=A0A8H9FSR5_9MICO|nr:hypothetical protein [Knoellia flava]KGN29318.1 hypothetical protein N798_14515 [Knoellia flava TL1]GGB67650.1 hypothetical protein GCM10011314_03610 [Knoellia flava]